MKYQKSMMKIMENLLFNRGENKSIAQTIRDTHTGRSSSFDALEWLENNGFIEIHDFGRQKIVRPVIDNYTLQYKYYLDSLRFKMLPTFVKLIVRVFTELLDDKEVKAVVLFGSSIKTEGYNDIDLLLLGKTNAMNDNKKILKLREDIEKFFGVLINIHFDELSFANFSKGVVVYQSSYLRLRSNIQKQYLEFLEWGFILLENKEVSSQQRQSSNLKFGNTHNKGSTLSVSNKKDNLFYSNAFNNALTNLSYCYANLNENYPEVKSDALKLFNNKYSIKTFNDLKERGIEIGKKIFK